MTHISNTSALATSPARTDALAITEAAYEAIDTDRVVRSKLRVEGDMLYAGDPGYELAAFGRVRIVGFGKASCKAVQAVEAVLHTRVTDGIAIDVHGGVCDIVQMAQGTHPRPSPQNVVATERIVNMAKDTKESDLVIMAVSGGGSSLLCWPMDECEQGSRFFDDASRVGMQIGDMNVIRRHISQVKGGALAAMFHPATVIALVFCDVPGDHFEDVASGPTYFDETTIEDAQKILDRYELTGYSLTETPKDRSLFEHVQNIPMVSNTAALEAMRVKATQLGYKVVDVGSARYDEPKKLAADMIAALGEKTAVIAGGEVSLKVTKKGGHGGRCQYIGLEALKLIGEHDLYLPFASDGIDNCDAAGVIADSQTLTRAKEQGLSLDEPLESFDTYTFFEKTGDLLMTGPTEANVSDLYLALRN